MKTRDQGQPIWNSPISWKWNCFILFLFILSLWVHKCSEKQISETLTREAVIVRNFYGRFLHMFWLTKPWSHSIRPAKRRHISVTIKWTLIFPHLFDAYFFWYFFRVLYRYMWILCTLWSPLVRIRWIIEGRSSCRRALLRVIIISFRSSSECEEFQAGKETS